VIVAFVFYFLVLFLVLLLLVVLLWQYRKESRLDSGWTMFVFGDTLQMDWCFGDSIILSENMSKTKEHWELLSWPMMLYKCVQHFCTFTIFVRGYAYCWRKMTINVVTCHTILLSNILYHLSFNFGVTPAEDVILTLLWIMNLLHGRLMMRNESWPL